MVTRYGDVQGVSGQVTAQVGTVTAQVAGILTAQVQGGVVSANVLSGNITAHGQVTAHGTITAEAKGTITAQVAGTLTAAISNVVTAESRGQVTAVGTITAQVGTVTAQVAGTLTAQVGTVTARVQGIDLSGVSAAAAPLLIGAYNATTAQPIEARVTQAPGGTIAASLNALIVDAQLFAASNNTNTPVAIEAEPLADGRANGGTHLRTVSHGHGYNGVTHDRMRNNATAVLLASASDSVGGRTASDQTNYNHAGVVLHLNVYGTAATAVIGGLIVQAKHNDKYRTITAWASSITTAGLFSYALHPGAGAGSQYAGVAAVPLPRDWRAIVSGALDANASASYQLDAHYVGYG